MESFRAMLKRGFSGWRLSPAAIDGSLERGIPHPDALCRTPARLRKRRRRGRVRRERRRRRAAIAAGAAWARIGP